MPIAQRSAKFDSLKPVAKTNDGIQEYTDLDYSALDNDTEAAEDSITMGDAASSLMKILYWAAEARGTTPQGQLAAVGARIEALLFLLNPGESRSESLSEIAKAADCTKQSVSKALVNLREAIGFRISAAKRWGTHWSSSQKRAKAA
jgi:hypothetical protein